MSNQLFVLLFLFGYQAFSQVINISNYQSKIQSVEKQISFLDSIKQETNNKEELASIYYQLGHIYYNKKSNYYLSKKNFKEALSINLDLGHKENIYNSFRFLGF